LPDLLIVNGKERFGTGRSESDLVFRFGEEHSSGEQEE
jgi:hypothetical protein